MYFVGIGAQRAATSWLWQLLQQHPGVANSPVKELHYFSSKYLPEFNVDYATVARNRILKFLETHQGKLSEPDGVRVRCLAHWLAMQSDEDYVEYFHQLQRATGKQVYGEIAPNYAMLPAQGFENICALFPDARFVFLMRNPVDRIWSNLHFHTKNAPTPPTENDAVRFAAEPRTRARSDYGATVRRVVSAAGRERLFVAFAEEITSPENGKPVREALLQFLGLDPFQFPKGLLERRPAALDIPAPSVELRQRLLAPCCDTYTFAKEFMGRLPPSWSDDLSAHERGVLEGAVDDELRGDWA
jgi:hypothetical protein